jgi:serine/threonine-protein kinase HipA
MTAGLAPPGALSPVDVYKGGELAAAMWRVGDTVTFRYRTEYVRAHGNPIAFTLPVTDAPLEVRDLRLPAFFAGLLPEGTTRRRDIQRAYHLAEDDELGLLALVGADTVGDVQVVPAGRDLPGEIVPPEVV